MGIGPNTYAAAAINSYQELRAHLGPYNDVKFVSHPSGPVSILSLNLT